MNEASNYPRHLHTHKDTNSPILCYVCITVLIIWNIQWWFTNYFLLSTLFSFCIVFRSDAVLVAFGYELSYLPRGMLNNTVYNKGCRVAITEMWKGMRSTTTTTTTIVIVFFNRTNATTCVEWFIYYTFLFIELCMVQKKGIKDRWQ